MWVGGVDIGSFDGISAGTDVGVVGVWVVGVDVGSVDDGIVVSTDVGALVVSVKDMSISKVAAPVVEFK